MQAVQVWMARCFTANANANACNALVQVKGPSSSHYRTVIKHPTVHPKQVEHDDSLLKQICVFVE